MKFIKYWTTSIVVFMLSMTSSSQAAVDICYSDKDTSGFCTPFGGMFCSHETTIKDVSTTGLTDVVISKGLIGFSMSFNPTLKIGSESKTLANDNPDGGDAIERAEQGLTFGGSVDNTFGMIGMGFGLGGYGYHLGDMALNNTKVISDGYMMSMGFTIPTSGLVAEYFKSGVKYSAPVPPCTGTPYITISDASVIEGDSGTKDMTFTVALNNPPSSGSVKVDLLFTTTAVSADGTDYTSVTSVLANDLKKNNFPKTFTVTIKGDTNIESDETFYLDVAIGTDNSMGAILIDSRAIGTIINDDTSSAVQVGWEQVTYENNEDTSLPYGGVSQMPMRITLDHAVDYPISVTYQTYNGTAIGDVDYRIAGGTVTIPAGQNGITVNMDIYHDEAIELTENFTVTLTNPTGSGGVVLKPDYDVATVSIMEQNTAPMCYSDNFNGTLDDKWRTLKASGGFTPQINSGHLKLTPGKKNISTAVTKDYEFPSKENLIIVEFQHYAYGGCFEESPAESGLGSYGADGIVAVLYDTTVGSSPTPGAYGGSMGYAQGHGLSGFQGGWLGLGLDEYGNFANPTEGRVGGPGFHTNAAVIRGDGVGTTGYEFLAEAYPLATPIAPAVDFHNPAKLPGDKFRLTVDARDTAHLYIRLERDTGSGYVTIINGFDAKNPVYNQTTTPDMVRFALTAGTGGGCNAHEIDELTVWGRCTPYNPNPPIPPANTGAVDVVDNYPLNGYTAQTGLKTKITSKTDANHFLDAVWLGTEGGSSAVPYYNAGNNDVLDMPVLFYASDINTTDDNGSCVTERYQFMGADSTPLVSTFHAGDTYARTTSTYTVQSNAKQYSKIMTKYINFYGMNLIDPSITCLVNSSNSGNIAGMPQCVNSENQYKQAFGQGAVDRCRSTLNGAPCEPNNHGIGDGVYNHAYGCYQCTLDALSTKGCSSDAFAIRPEKFEIISTHYDWANILRSAQEYNTTINAYNYNSIDITQEYNVANANTKFALVTTKYNRNNTVDGTMMGVAAFGGSDFNMTNGISTKDGFVSNEVAGLSFDNIGKVNISIQDQNWSDIDIDDTPSDCTGRFICSDKNVTYIPDHFDFHDLNITNNNGNPGSFTYIANEVDKMAGRIHTQMRALNKNNGVTTNFAPFPLWENNVTVVPVVVKSTYLYPDANESNITNLPIGFVGGIKTIAWNETNASQDLRFNFRRDINLPQNSFDVNGGDLNISMTSHYVDGIKSTDINGLRLGTVQPAAGSSKFVYGRVIPRDVRVFGPVSFTANAWYEVFNTPSIAGTSLTGSRNDSSWFINRFHSDVPALYDGDANVTFINTTPANMGGASATGIETYGFGAQTPPYSAKAHIDTDPWLWYGVNASPYSDPSALNLDCLTHPCFNINVVPAVGATGSAKSTNEGTKASKASTSGGGTWRSTTDYAPAIR